MTDCIFCKIANGSIPTEKLLDTEDLCAFRDIHPAAPTHILIIPKRHIATLNDVDATDTALMGKMLLAARDIARNTGIAESGYRTIVNVNRGGGQEVFHLHLHMLGGRPMATMG